MAMKMKIKKKDRVIVLAGKDKGKVGEITAVIPKENRVVVSGINMIARHTKPSQGNPQGGIVRRKRRSMCRTSRISIRRINKAVACRLQDGQG